MCFNEMTKIELSHNGRSVIENTIPNHVKRI
jgi:hypothetical protein